MEPTVYNLVNLLEDLRGLFCMRWEPLKGRKMAFLTGSFWLLDGRK